MRIRGLLCDEHFGSSPNHSTALQLARHAERVSRNLGERRQTVAVFLHVAKAFDTAWVDGLLYKLTIFNFFSFLAKTVSSCLKGRTFEVRFQASPSTSSGWNYFTRSVKPVCQRHSRALSPRRVDTLRIRHGRHTNVPSDGVAR